MTETAMLPESAVCNICGYKRLLRFRANASDTHGRETISVVECFRCGFAWQHPFGLEASESIAYFENAYSGKSRESSDYFKNETKLAISRLELDFLSELPVTGRDLLDLGAGAGIFARVAANQGWKVTAVDPAIEVTRLAGIANIRAIRGGLECLNADDVFDVITLWDVIEHVPNPHAVIRAIAQHLKPGGWIVLETGNYKSAARAIGGINHWIYQRDHRWFFSPESLKHVLAECKFGFFVIPARVFRPSWTGPARKSRSAFLRLIASLTKHPLQYRAAIKRFAKAQQARKWPLSDLEIFTIAAQKNNDDAI